MATRTFKIAEYYHANFDNRKIIFYVPMTFREGQVQIIRSWHRQLRDSKKNPMNSVIFGSLDESLYMIHKDHIPVRILENPSWHQRIMVLWPKMLFRTHTMTPLRPFREFEDENFETGGAWGNRARKDTARLQISVAWAIAALSAASCASRSVWRLFFHTESPEVYGQLNHWVESCTVLWPPVREGLGG